MRVTTNQSNEPRLYYRSCTAVGTSRAAGAAVTVRTAVTRTPAPEAVAAVVVTAHTHTQREREKAIEEGRQYRARLRKGTSANTIAGTSATRWHHRAASTAPRRPCQPSESRTARHFGVCTGAGGDHGMDHHQNPLRFPYVPEFGQSHDLHPHTGGAGAGCSLGASQYSVRSITPPVRMPTMPSPCFELVRRKMTCPRRLRPRYFVTRTGVT
eukprot:COSAG01_NODE_174_length_23022_cov_528.590978_10_plen_212_part_00